MIRLAKWLKGHSSAGPVLTIAWQPISPRGGQGSCINPTYSNAPPNERSHLPVVLFLHGFSNDFLGRHPQSCKPLAAPRGDLCKADQNIDEEIFHLIHRHSLRHILQLARIGSMTVQ